jgi:DeoR/GlpR family transcriptional regulator of sugar metabolism
MSARVRREEIVRLAATSGLASVEELSTELGVTPSTIRRDLAKLTSLGKLARTYGGVMSLDPHPEASLRQRLGVAHVAKHAIAQWALGTISSGETILLDAGSTTGALAEEIKASSLTNLTVVTAGISAMSTLAELEGLDVIALGGRLRALSQAFIGPLAEAAVSRMTFDRAFIGTDAVHPELGICEADLEQTRLKELMMSRAAEVYVLAHGQKLGQRPFHAWATMPASWTLVTDESAPESEVGRFRANGVEVVTVPTWTSGQAAVSE